MGLSFHYKGRCKNSKALPLLIEKVKDIAENFKWKYHIYETNFLTGRLRKKE